MTYIQISKPAGGGSKAASPIAALMAEGVSRADIDMALDLQRAQRQAGVPVLSLRVICGRAESMSQPLRATTALASTPVPRPRPATSAPHITRRPIRAGSVQTGSPAEGDFVRALPPQQLTQLKSACYRTFLRAKAAAAAARTAEGSLDDLERRLIGFTTSCRDIMLKLIDEARYRKGWCVPAYETIMRWTGLSRSTVHRSLRVLADLGLTEWIRRFHYTRDTDLGARSEQTSNLYRLALPEWLSKLLGMSAPPPDDEAVRRQTAIEDHALMLATLTPRERARSIPAQAEARFALVSAALRYEARLAAEALGRECQKQTPPHENIIK